MRILLVEYGIMGGLAGMIAMLAGTGMAYMFVTQILTLPWQWPWVTLVSIVLVSIAMALLVGGVVLYRVLRVRPATILRHDG
jgi:putative ABC transport system permease protein